ncbi:MAG: DUF3791 domain-containing protein [Firmicutes bacterium]|nr:DUF3791 domain-containing protein [Bacillota bacterium]
MKEIGNFMAYCAEIYKEEKNLSGKQLGELFNKFDIWSYINDCYGALHVTGPLYTIQCIDEYISANQ